MLSLQKKIFFSLFTPKCFIQKFISILHVKWTEMNMGKAGWKFEVLSEHSFSAATKIYILFFNLTHYLISLMSSFHFPQWKIFFPIHWYIPKILGNGISQSFKLSLKGGHPLLCEFPILFSRSCLIKLGHKFSQLMHKFNIWILKCWPGAVHISKFFSIHEKMGNWDFCKV